jgi:hypothetical protein
MIYKGKAAYDDGFKHSDECIERAQKQALIYGFDGQDIDRYMTPSEYVEDVLDFLGPIDAKKVHCECIEQAVAWYAKYESGLK